MYSSDEQQEHFDFYISVARDEEGREQVVRVEEQLPVIE
jgi:hypothetical protein